MDKSKFGPGPWQDEPDEEEFEAHGLQCLVQRKDMRGYLCGYVCLPAGHPWFGFTEDMEWPCKVHGGITCTSHVRPRQSHRAPIVMDPESVWIGFDCCHPGDLWPYDRLGLNDPGDVYRTFAWVRQQVIDLARQAAEALANAKPRKTSDE